MLEPHELPGERLKRAPLHRQLAARLRQEIATRYKPGDRLESQNELAERFNISVLTVREALSGLADEGVIERRRGSGTYVVDPTRNQAVGVLMELDIAHPNTSYSFRRLAQQVRLNLRRLGLRVRLYSGYVAPEDSQQPYGSELTTCPDFIEDLDAGRIHGVIVVAGISRELRLLIEAQRIPLLGSDPALTFGVDHRPGSLVHMGMEYLVKQGRRKVAFMSWGDPSQLLNAARQRGLELRPEWLRCDMHPAIPGAGGTELREIWNARPDKPDGLLVTDDVLFTDAIPALTQLGIRVPEDLLIVTQTCAGASYPAMFPFARLELDPDAHAATLVQLMSEVLHGRKPNPPRVQMEPRLIV